jgi:nucleoside phosphorylase
LQGLALIGWAGGLRPDLAPGDIVLASHALDEQGEPVPCTVLDLPGAEIGALLTVSAPLMTAQAKRAARSGVTFANEPLAVEMEAYPLALWAWQHQVPFCHARVILDAADEALPDLADTLDAMGRIRPGCLAQRLLRRPWLSVPLLRLGVRTWRLGPVLTRVARDVAQAWRSEPPCP